jgi:GntR family transcriptional regulator
MDIILSNASGEPIYAQIVSQIKTMILSGSLKEGDALPSMRNLAMQLRISVITTKRAYEELEGAGLIYTQPGRGSFVAGGGHDALREKRLEELAETLRKARTLAADCGLTGEEVWALYTRLEEEAK